MITQLKPMPSSVDPTLKKNLDNLNMYGASKNDIDIAIADNNQFISSQVIEIVGSIDLKTTGTTTLYTIPTGYEFFLDSIFIKCTEATAITVEASINLGYNSTDFNNIADALLLENLTDIGLFFKVGLSGSNPIGSASDALSVKVITASIGTSQTVEIYVIGLLRSV